MPLLVSAPEKKIAVDDDGYLVNIDDWDEDAARAIAAKDGIGEVTEDMLEMLKFIREYYKIYGFFPIPGSVCRRVHEPAGCIQKKFPNALIAWKAAGLPHPEEPVVSLLAAGQSPG